MSKTQYDINRKIEKLIDEKEFKNEPWKKSELQLLEKYKGDGGLISKGAKGTGVLYEFYTPNYLCEILWKLAWTYGFDPSGTVLEPACGTGNLIQFAPDKSRVEAFETSRYSRKIAEARFPKATIYEEYFETAFLSPERFVSLLPRDQLTWLKGYPYSLVIGNPPYGKHFSQYSGIFPKPRTPTLESFFMLWGLKLLRPGGLMVMLVPQGFMRTGTLYQKVKDQMMRLADFVDAFRLPKVFHSSEVPTDILILKRK